MIGRILCILGRHRRYTEPGSNKVYCARSGCKNVYRVLLNRAARRRGAKRLARLASRSDALTHRPQTSTKGR